MMRFLVALAAVCMIALPEVALGEANRPVPAPSMSAPPGWSFRPSGAPIVTTVGFGTWERGNELIDLYGTPLVRSLNDIIAGELQLEKRFGRTVYASNEYTVCNGTQQGWLIDKAHGSTRWFLVQIGTALATYDILYVRPSATTANPDAERAIKSACVPGDVIPAFPTAE